MRLSIVTVSFNAEKYIENTLLSILNQTVPVYEYILFDGASKDSTYQIIQSYEPKFKERGIRFIHKSEPDKGISDAFNKGVRQATGELIGIINADDELMPDTNKILSDLYDDSDAGVFYGNCLWVDKEKNTQHISYPKQNLDKLLYYMVLIHPSTFVRKGVYEQYGVFNLEYKCCMDKELLYRLYRNGVRFQYVNETLTKFKSGGVSDRNIMAYKEGSRLAIENGEPKWKVYAIEYKKRFHGFLVCQIKKTPIYAILKKETRIQ